LKRFSAKSIFGGYEKQKSKGPKRPTAEAYPVR